MTHNSDAPPPATPRPEGKLKPRYECCCGPKRSLMCPVHSLAADPDLAPSAPEEPTAEAARSASPQLFTANELALIASEFSDFAYEASENPNSENAGLSRVFQAIARKAGMAVPAGHVVDFTADDSEAERAGIDDGHLAAQAKTGRTFTVRDEIRDKLHVFAAADRNPVPLMKAITQGQCEQFLVEMFEKAEADLTTLRSTHATLQRALRQYGQHQKGCGMCPSTVKYGVTFCEGESCTCGWDLALNGAPGTE